jgi:hypothetical protein
MSIYTHTLIGQEFQEINDLPDLSVSSLQEQRSVATGTNDVASSALTYTGKIGVQKSLSADPHEHQNCDNDSETAFLNTGGWTIIELLYPPIPLLSTYQ